jgi:hypothetical protein
MIIKDSIKALLIRCNPLLLDYIMGNPNPSIETSYQKCENVEEVYLMSIQTIEYFLFVMYC